MIVNGYTICAIILQAVPEGGASALGLSNVGGVFVVLLMGMSIACLIAFFEHYLDKRKKQRKSLSVSKSNFSASIILGLL